MCGSRVCFVNRIESNRSMSSNTTTPSPPGTPGQSCLTSFLAVLGFSVVSGMLLLLPTGFLGPAFVLGGVLFFGLFAMHYLLWGRWLDAELRKSEPPLEEDEPGPLA